MHDKRSAPRKRTLKPGRIVFNQRYSAADCTIKNLSEGGALLAVSGTIGIPDQFALPF